MNMVYVTQEQPRLNYGPAEMFGDVRFLTEHDLSNIDGSLVNRSIVADIKSKLSGFDPSADYLAPSGSPLVTGIAMMILNKVPAVKTAGFFNALRWSNRDRAYEKVRIELETRS